MRQSLVHFYILVHVDMKVTSSSTPSHRVGVVNRFTTCPGVSTFVGQDRKRRSWVSVARSDVRHVDEDRAENSNHVRRSLLLAMGWMVVAGTASPLHCRATEEPFAVYKGSKYTIQYPSTWDLSSKAGADVLFIDTERRGVNLGITILPVMISSVKDYGSVGEVAEKILQTEKAKDGNISSTLIRSDSLELASGSLAYDYEYEIQTTRGTKRILSRVCIRNGELFVVNGAIPCGKVETCDVDPSLLDTMSRSVWSFTF